MTKQLLKVLISAITVCSVCACATPATNSIKLSKDELKREQQIQQNLAKTTKQKHVVRKHKDLKIYEARLHKVADPLAKAAKRFCKKGNCNYAFRIVERDDLNAWADGKSINFTPIMMDFLDNDLELAIVAAHELSHNVMGHIRKQQQNTIIGTILDVAAAANGVETGGLFGAIGNRSYSQGFENEADYIAIYIMANAGYDISKVNHIWRKMSLQMPNSIHSSFFSTHPSNPERFLRMQKTIDEVKAKQIAHQPLNPNYKS